MRLISIAALALCLGWGSPALAWKSKGEIGLEGRRFDKDSNTLTYDYGAGVMARLEVSNKSKPFKKKLRLFGRVDQRDPNRSVVLLEEAWVEYKAKPLKFRLKVGADIVNWSATEAFHPADILNSRNLDSDLESLEKVGEPMVQASIKLGSGRLAAFALPIYLAPQLTSPNSRLNFGLPGVQLDDALRLGRNGELTDSMWQQQGALLLTQRLGSADISLHTVHHIDRSQPEIVVEATALNSLGGATPQLLVRSVTQVGGTYQHALGGFVLKLEAGHRIFAEPAERERFVELRTLEPLGDRDHTTVAFGLEYTIGHESGSETVLLFEGQNVFVDDKDLRRNLQVFQRDVLAGFRYAANDVNSREVIASVIVDAGGEEEVLGSVMYKQRLGDTWTVSGSVRFFHAPVEAPAPGAPPPSPSGLQAFDKSDHVRFALTRYF